jgi:hypothetical protein
MTATTRLATAPRSNRSVPQPVPQVIAEPTGRAAAHERRVARVRAARGVRPVCSAPVRRRLVDEELRAPVAPAVCRVRVTRRGRLLLLLVLAALLFTAFSLGRSASEAASEPAEAVQLEQTTVQPGDTLWAVARRIAPDNDPREVIDEIRRVNDLASSELTAGQQLLLPPAR